MRRPNPLALVLISLSLAPACEKGSAGSGSAKPDDAEVGSYGYEDASSPDMAPIPHALAPDDMVGVQARGMTLWRMQRAMRVGDRAFAGFVGVTSAKFIALASIDPGERSGQVAYYQWDEADLADGDATAEEARNWIVVSLELDPDQSLEPQTLDGKPDGEVRRTIAALLVAQAAAEREHPDARWVAYTFREQQIQGGSPTGLRQTRIYMIGADDKSPDLEYTVLDPSKRKQPPEIAETVVHLAGGSTNSLPLTTPAALPGPTTIARAVAAATVTQKPVKLVDGSGGNWEVAPKTGELTRK